MIIGNRYEILERIGAGGMAIVYKARCRLLNRFVAVKMLRAEFNNDVEFLKRFETEAQAAASLSHANIVSVYDVGIHDGMHYIVMEYVEGTTLKEYMQRKGKLTTAEIVDFSSQIASALEHAHSKKIIHHDIKPHNIIITDSGQVKVTDFGLARAVSAATTVAGTGAIGSVHYSSPEQSRGGFTDEKSDIYSLGITMYEMATGVLPFDGDTPVAVAMKHLEKKPEKPTYYNPELPQYIENIILKAIEKEPRNRYQSAAELLADLKEPERTTEPPSEENKFDTVRIPEIVQKPKPVEEREVLAPVKPEEGKKSPKKTSTKEDKVAVVAAVITTVIIVAVFGIVLAHLFSNGTLGGGTIEVPDFTGMTVEEASALAKENGFEINVDGEEFSSEYAEGMIMSQDPKAEQLVQSTGKVNVIVSLGSEGLILQDYSDWESDKALKDIRSLGLTYTIEEKNDDTVEKGKVIGTAPPAKSQVSEGTRVIVYVSLGAKKDKTMPSVIGRTLEEAKEILDDNSLKLDNVSYKESDAQRGTIISQSPASGKSVTDGESVDVVISEGRSQTSSSSSHSTTQTQTQTENHTTNENTGEATSELLIE